MNVRIQHTQGGSYPSQVVSVLHSSVLHQGPRSSSQMRDSFRFRRYDLMAKVQNGDAAKVGTSASALPKTLVAAAKAEQDETVACLK